MSDPFLGQITMFAGNFAPQGWALCDGQLLAVGQNDALFSLLGTIYGGDGRTTFGLPDLRGRIPLHEGQGPGLSPRKLGIKSGVENVTLNTNQLPAHTHQIRVSTAAGTQNNPGGAFLAASPNVRVYWAAAPSDALNTSSITSIGGSQNQTNLMPFQCVNFIIALAGIYPSRQ